MRPKRASIVRPFESLTVFFFAPGPLTVRERAYSRPPIGKFAPVELGWGRADTDPCSPVRESVASWLKRPLRARSAAQPATTCPAGAILSPLQNFSVHVGRPRPDTAFLRWSLARRFSRAISAR